MPQLAADVESAPPGKHDVEKEERGLAAGGGGKDGSSSKKSGDVVAGGAEVVLDQVGNVRIVLDDIDQIGVAGFVCRLEGIHGQEASLAKSLAGRQFCRDT